MADYKRVIAYMYQYVKGEKTKNVGYARIELRNGYLKITIHLQLQGYVDGIFPTYLIQRDNDNLDLIYYGDSTLKNQIIDSKLSSNEDNIMDTGFNFSDIGGILLFLNEEVFFATEWDDRPIILREVMSALRPKAKVLEPKLKVNEPQIKVVEPKLEEDTKVKTTVDQIYVDLRRAPMAWNKVWTSMPSYQIPTRPILEEAEVLDQGEAKEDQPKVKEVALESKEEQPSVQPEINNNNEEVMAAGILQDRDVKSSRTAGNRSTKPNYESSYNQQTDNPVAEYIFKNYQRIYPFEDNEIIVSVKIEPKDIGYFPKEVWTLSGNSFLLHGFYCYNHLIFAKMKVSYGYQYILGVPGIYHNKELYMAKMFGFYDFKSIRRRELRQGDFGYWYIAISM